MTSGLADAIKGHLPAAVLQQMAASGNGGGISAGSVLDPEKLKALPPVVADAVRQGLAEQLHEVFLLGLPILAVAFIATLFIKHVPLRETVHAHEDQKRHDVEDFGHDLLDTMGATRTSARSASRFLRADPSPRHGDRLASETVPVSSAPCPARVR